jgi:hypothetical protein
MSTILVHLNRSSAYGVKCSFQVYKGGHSVFLLYETFKDVDDEVEHGLCDVSVSSVCELHGIHQSCSL